MRLRRALLFMPGDSARKIERAATLDVDGVVLDLEDGVAPDQRPAARQMVRERLGTLDFGRSERLVRVNRVGSGWTTRDVIETIGGRPDGYMLPKVERAGDLLFLDRLLDDLEGDNGMEAGTIGLHAIIESALGLLQIEAIARASSRLRTLILGAEDLAGDMGLTRTAGGQEIFYARGRLVTTAAALGLQAIDGVYLALDETEGAEREARAMREMGFEGKLAIHPDQVMPFQRAFSPTADEIAAAQRIVAAAERQLEAGVGAFRLDGRMIDVAIVRPARHLLDRARAAGLL